MVAGSYKDSAGTHRGFMRAPDGTFTTFAADGSETYALSIDDRNRITGTFIKDGTIVLGFERRNDGTIGTVEASRVSLHRSCKHQQRRGLDRRLLEREPARHARLSAKPVSRTSINSTCLTACAAAPCGAGMVRAKLRCDGLFSV